MTDINMLNIELGFKYNTVKLKKVFMHDAANFEMRFYRWHGEIRGKVCEWCSEVRKALWMVGWV